MTPLIRETSLHVALVNMYIREIATTKEYRIEIV